MWKLLGTILLCYFAWIFWLASAPTSSPPPSTSATFIVPTVQDSIQQYLHTCAPLAVQEMKRTGIPASIKLGQALLESRFGSSPLARQANNHFGIKAEPKWDNQPRHCLHSYEWSPRRDRMVPVLSCFRHYHDVEDCYRGHSEFLRHRAHYDPLFQLNATDIEGWAKGLQKAGYATDPTYSQKLLHVIEKYQLKRFDHFEQ